MPPAGVTWVGLAQFKRELQALAPDLVAEANGILLEAAEGAKDRVFATYPRGKTGNLRLGLRVRPNRGAVLAGATVTTSAPHAHLYERGTRVRKNRHGDNRGAMPANPTFVPITDSYRRTALDAVISRLYQHGAKRVEGDPDGD